jgi:hypothetical protein
MRLHACVSTFFCRHRRSCWPCATSWPTLAWQATWQRRSPPTPRLGAPSLGAQATSRTCAQLCAPASLVQSAATPSAATASSTCGGQQQQQQKTAAATNDSSNSNNSSSRATVGVVAAAAVTAATAAAAAAVGAAAAAAPAAAPAAALAAAAVVSSSSSSSSSTRLLLQHQQKHHNNAAHTHASAYPASVVAPMRKRTLSRSYDTPPLLVASPTCVPGSLSVNRLQRLPQQAVLRGDRTHQSSMAEVDDD